MLTNSRGLIRRISWGVEQTKCNFRHRPSESRGESDWRLSPNRQAAFSRAFLQSSITVLVMSISSGEAANAALGDNVEMLWTLMRTSRIPGLPNFISQFVIWLMMPALVLMVFYYAPLLLSRRFTWLQGKGKYLQFFFLLWGASYFLPAVLFWMSSSYGTTCDLYNKNITPQLVYTDAVAVCTYSDEFFREMAPANARKRRMVLRPLTDHS